MKNLLIASLTTVLLLTACSQSGEENTVKKEVKIEKRVVDGSDASLSDNAVSKASIGISGMSCEMACVSKVKSALVGLEGVKNVEVDFDQEREVDIAHVEFDHNSISEKEMISAIEGLHDGKYQIQSVDIEIREFQQEEDDEEGEETAYNYNLGLKLPNIFNVVKVLVH